ncbi:MAG: nitroreductase family protein [Ruminococcus sp.]
MFPLVIAIGYGAEDGVPHHSKSLESVIRIKDEMPHWFEKGVQAALLAPTAVNQQKFLFTLVNDHTVRVEAGWGLYTEVDLGIVKYHFELAAGDHFEWAES